MRFTRCSFEHDHEDMSATRSGAAHNWAGNGGNVGLYVSCTLSYSMPDVTNEVIVRQGAGSDVHMYNCSLYLRGSYDNGAGIVFASAAAGRLHITQCMFDMESNDQGYLTRGNLDEADIVASRNFYSDMIGSAKYGSGADPDVNNEADWSKPGGIDEFGIYNESGDFSSELTLCPAARSWLAVNADINGDPKAPEGINGVHYVGHYGAWQNPMAPVPAIRSAQ
jgi:hypothetical protein